LNRTIKGAGGTTQLSNGTGVSSFAIPGGSVSSQNFTFNFGFSYKVGPSRLGIDTITEGTLSSKRNYNLMLSYSYAISGGRF
jgi:hypothetical protein